ncbi:hypothetical protein, partial [Nonomuraea turkmeniaca]|uniref:hypothetical protein n=1 Tax=Nonomuraea turkmeniaca TaxID=103838 RepID=UPI001B86AD85
LLDRLDAREQALTRQIEQTQTDIDSLTARLSELSQEVEHLRISRKTLLSLAEADPAPAEPDAPRLVGFDHPYYQQILTVFGQAEGSLRARDLALAMGLAPDAQRHPKRPRQAQTPGQPRHPRRNRARLVHPAAPVDRTATHRPADLIRPQQRKGHQLV